MSFLVGIPPIFVYYAIESKGFTQGTYDTPPWTYAGGLFGALYIFVIILTTQKLGSATVLSIIVASQVITSVIVDHYGILGMQQRNATWGRIGGAFLVICGSVMIASL